MDPIPNTGLLFIKAQFDSDGSAFQRMSEMHEHARIFRLDGDFRIYRRHGNRVIPLLAPDRPA